MSALVRLSVLSIAITFVCLLGQATAQMEIFTSQMTDATGWGYSHFGGTNAPGPGDTTTAMWAWDYSMMGIPEAPNSGAGDAATSGLRLTANDTGLDGGDSIAVHYQDAAFTGQYTLQVDVWANWASNDGSGIGTTEHAGVFAGFDPDDVNLFLAPSQNGAGLTFSTDGDCGNCDYILNKDVAELDTFSGQYSVTDFGFGNQPGFDNSDVDPNGGGIDLPTAFPSFDIETATNNMNGSGTQTTGAAGFQWVTVTVEVDTDAIGNGTNGTPGTAKFTVESARTGIPQEIGTVDNSVDDDPNDGIDTGEAPVGLDGGIAMMMIDFFGGSPVPPELGFILFDNVKVFDGFLGGGGPDGDFDDNGFYECNDVDQLVAEIVAVAGGAMPNLDFDLTDDGDVDIDDLDAWRAEAGDVGGLTTSGDPVLIGDATLDGTVDGLDFIEWNENKFTNTPAWCAGDFTADGVVDGLDFIEWNNNKFTSADGVAVPEPTCAVWFCLAGLAFLRRRA